MRLHGLCTICHRFRLVAVTGSGLLSPIPQGICDECAEAAEERR